MKKFFTLLSVLSLASFSYCQVSLTSLNTQYLQDFDGLASSGTTSSLMPANWLFLETLTNANTTYTIELGAGTAGETYSYGAAGSTDRALGSIASSNLSSKYGASFKNDTGSLIDQLDVAYVGEEWRFGSVGRGTKDQITFEYSLNATSLSTGTWVAVSALTYNTTDITLTTGAKDGNTYKTSLSNSITGLNIPAGSTFWIRFSDVNISGTDDGLAIDDFSLTPKNSTLSLNYINKSKNIFLKNTVVDNTLSFQTKGNASVKIYNVNGQLVKSALISANKTELDVSSLAKGNYLVTAEMNGEKISQKIVKK